MKCIHCDQELTWFLTLGYYICQNTLCLCMDTCNVRIVGNEIDNFIISLRRYENIYWIQGDKSENYFEIEIEKSVDTFISIFRMNFIYFPVDSFKEKLDEILNKILKMKAFI